MGEWSFLTNHARVLVCIARDPGVRLREIAYVLGVTERRAFGIINDLTKAGYVVKQKDGQRNRYRIQNHLSCRASTRRTLSAGNSAPPERFRAVVEHRTKTPVSAALSAAA
jgi:DNA-binding IclR family transcriptional regulator